MNRKTLWIIEFLNANEVEGVASRSVVDLSSSSSRARRESEDPHIGSSASARPAADHLGTRRRLSCPVIKLSQSYFSFSFLLVTVSHARKRVRGSKGNCLCHPPYVCDKAHLGNEIGELTKQNPKELGSNLSQRPNSSWVWYSSVLSFACSTYSHHAAGIWFAQTDAITHWILAPHSAFSLPVQDNYQFFTWLLSWIGIY